MSATILRQPHRHAPRPGPHRGRVHANRAGTIHLRTTTRIGTETTACAPRFRRHLPILPRPTGLPLRRLSRNSNRLQFPPEPTSTYVTKTTSYRTQHKSPTP